MVIYYCSTCNSAHDNERSPCPQIFTMKPLTETVTVRREVPKEIADLVNFARVITNLNLNTTNNKYLTDDELIVLARVFWETHHGED
jgi:hypothetical protein